MEKSQPGGCSYRRAPNLAHTRRAEPRYRTEDYVVRVFRTDPPDCFDAAVTSVSGAGLGLRSPTPIPVGHEVLMLLKNQIVAAKVRYSVENEAGTYDIGVQICSLHDRPEELP
jgi:hypothetical protein